VSLFITTDTGGAGAGNVFPMNVEVDLFSISHADLGDGTHAGFGEDPPNNNLIQITYDRSDGGIPATRLDTLVNTNFGVNANGIDIIVIGAGANFTLLDGTMAAGNGVTLPVGDADNPTGSVLVIYDTSDNNGTGICVRKQGDGDGTYKLEEPSSVILYHELSHAFHLANGDPLSLSASGCTASPEENRAETDENDMRDQLGLPHRDATDHCGSAGCQSSSCCIVASVASGSIYSDAVNSLREVRDGILRGSEIGHDFFNHFYQDYYGFSPEVCRLMARSPELLNLIRVRFLAPLTVVLDLIRAHSIDRLDDEALGLRFAANLSKESELLNLTHSEIELARVLLAGAPLPDTDIPLVTELANLLGERAWSSTFVKWTLVEPIKMLVDALSWHRENVNLNEIGKRLGASFDQWSVQMPITPVWNTLSMYTLNEELEFLERTLLSTEESRRFFGKRLVAALPAEKAVVVSARWRM